MSLELNACASWCHQVLFNAANRCSTKTLPCICQLEDYSFTDLKHPVICMVASCLPSAISRIVAEASAEYSSKSVDLESVMNKRNPLRPYLHARETNGEGTESSTFMGDPIATSSPEPSTFMGDPVATSSPETKPTTFIGDPLAPYSPDSSSTSWMAPMSKVEPTVPKATQPSSLLVVPPSLPSGISITPVLPTSSIASDSLFHTITTAKTIEKLITTTDVWVGDHSLYPSANPDHKSLSTTRLSTNAKFAVISTVTVVVVLGVCVAILWWKVRKRTKMGKQGCDLVHNSEAVEVGVEGHLISEMDARGCNEQKRVELDGTSKMQEMFADSKAENGCDGAGAAATNNSE